MTEARDDAMEWARERSGVRSISISRGRVKVVATLRFRRARRGLAAEIPRYRTRSSCHFLRSRFFSDEVPLARCILGRGWGFFMGAGREEGIMRVETRDGILGGQSC
ncbi:hypothetical protein ACQJBY_040774 [Aegilops geniculata]